MSYKRMEQSKNRWKEKAKNKAKENRELKKQNKKLSEKLQQATNKLQKHKGPTSGAQATSQKPAQDEKKNLKGTGSS